MIFNLMKLSVLAAVCATANAFPFVSRQNTPSPAQIAALAPDLGAFPNTNPNRFGDCDGPPQANGQIPRVPCQCPPLHDAYIAALTANIAAGHAVNNTVVRISFPTGNSVQDKHGRITAAIITLQNLNGPGKGCPGVSTTLGIQSNNLDKCGDFFCGDAPASSSSSTSTTSTRATTTSTTTPVVQAAPTQAPVNVGSPRTVTVTSIKVVTSVVTVTAGAPPATTTTRAAAQATTTSSSAAATTTTAAAVGNGQITRDIVDQLAPQLGSHPNNNPNSAGDCDGPAQPDGSIKRVPCACPPERPAFIDSLFADILAGHAVHNPSVKVTFPTGNSKSDQHARITAASIALQNLNGPGQGCPFVSTTFAQQSNAIDA